ncbi:PLP-dependent aminotransferase family protein [Actinocorallia sp. A-T 12471]|uniref:aminotransferase-like domain-containing protein n=1 Tax=Actinocorallia sp. A-T 12471 TaxID=3089813 RepID=UPI0029CEA264|nr:PLP-dependent aminotransferase family protein [Actinocorallia sp. A-T 12471]MDX6743427.1 PLP-dependent aminotransferase family protein [Actinocorallia sp. A-T 12471]
MNNDSSVASLATRLRAEATGLRAGTRMPSSRTLTERYRVSPVTVSRALALLVAEGVVVTRPGSGTFVAERRAAASGEADRSWQNTALGERRVDPEGVALGLIPVPDGIVPLVGGYLPEGLRPTRALAAASARAARRPQAWGAPPPEGLPELRAWFAGLTGCTPEDVLVSGGGQSSLWLALRAVVAPGGPVLVESPTYPGLIAAARAAGLTPVPVPVDGDGVRPDLLAEAFARTGARAFVCQPTFHNPTGSVLPPDRRAGVLKAARQAGAFVIEDDFARHLSMGAAPAPLVAGDAAGTVVHIASLTKATAPSLRISGIVARGPVAERIRAAQLVESFFPARPLQETALEFVSSPSWPRHLRAVSAELRRRRDVLAAALAEHVPEIQLPSLPSGGLYLWGRLPEGLDDAALTETARAHGVAIAPGRPYFPAEPPAPYLRLSYSAAADTDALVEGVRRLSAALRASR